MRNMAESRESDGSAVPEDGVMISGRTRVGGAIRNLAARSKAGDIIVIDALDLNSVDARALVDAAPAAVVNAQRTVSGRHPASGACVLLEAGIVVVDDAGAAVLALRDGATVTVDDGRVVRGGDEVAAGTVLTAALVDSATGSARAQLRVQTASFGTNALARLEAEPELFFEGAGLPDLGVDVRGRAVVVVGVGDAVESDLRALRRFLRERKPIMIAEGGAADAVARRTRTPQVIVGGIDAASEAALTAAHVVVPTSDAAGRTRMDALGTNRTETSIRLAPTDLAILAAYHAGASVIVVAGRSTTAIDTLAASPEVGLGEFLVRLVTARRTADAGVVAATYRHRHSAWFVWAVLVVAIATLAVAVWASPDARSLIVGVWDTVRGWFGVGP